MVIMHAAVLVVFGIIVATLGSLRFTKVAEGTRERFIITIFFVSAHVEMWPQWSVLEL